MKSYAQEKTSKCSAARGKGEAPAAISAPLPDEAGSGSEQLGGVLERLASPSLSLPCYFRFPSCYIIPTPPLPR